MGMSPPMTKYTNLRGAAGSSQTKAPWVTGWDPQSYKHNMISLIAKKKIDLKQDLLGIASFSFLCTPIHSQFSFGSGFFFLSLGSHGWFIEENRVMPSG